MKNGYSGTRWVAAMQGLAVMSGHYSAYYRPMKSGAFWTKLGETEMAEPTRPRD